MALVGARREATLRRPSRESFDELARRGNWIPVVREIRADLDTALSLFTRLDDGETSFLFDPSYVVKDYRMLSLRPIERGEAYRADITYGTNHEFGFDYLRDNMKFSLDEYVQRELNYAIVDEVDNILIDEARTTISRRSTRKSRRS